MSITDELRKWGRATLADTSLLVRMEAIADRIDAEHESMLGDWDYWESTHIELPKDADGEYTNADDEMFWKEDGDSAGRVTAIGVGQRAGWVWTLLDGCSVSVGHKASLLRHYHAPTVEDVLREFSEKMNENLGMYTGEAIDADEWRMADERTIAEYAKRLRLAEGEDA